ncbi:MAG: XdhC/CoxI family protein [Pseudomonadota bacterium]|nr:XdhC/CoxI family protein [Pseudomonadota bacterium]
MKRFLGVGNDTGDKPSVPEGTASLSASATGGSEPGGLLRLCAEKREHREPLALAIVMACHGSTPRKPGTAMLVGADGAAAGTVGGGSLEARIVAAARQAIQERQSRRWIFSLTPRQAADDGMICGGSLEVLVDSLGDFDSTREEIMTRALRTWEAGRDCLLVYSLRAGEAVTTPAGKPFFPPAGQAARKEEATGRGEAPRGEAVAIGLGLMSGDEFVIGTLDTFGSEPKELEAAIRKECRRREAVLLNMGPRGRYFLLPLTIPITVVIAGAGHITRALAPLCRFAGFRTAVFDDRPEFACREFIPAADHIEVTPSFNNCFQAVATGPEDYIVIATRGHLSDAEVLAQALATGAAYIGMLGSAKKREAIYRQLVREGCDPEALARVHCPVGLAIGARSPEEIAVSIVAGLIACRSAGRRTE